MVLVSPSVSQTCRLILDFIACAVRNLKLTGPFLYSQGQDEWAFSVKLPML